MMAVVPPPPPEMSLRAYSDPVIFRDDRVLRTLLKKETRYLPRVANFFAQVQTEVSLGIIFLDHHKAS